MKISISLPQEDIVYVDDYVHRTGAQSRSSVLHQAVALLRMSELENAYAESYQEWHDSEDRELWESTTSDGIASDGLVDASR